MLSYNKVQYKARRLLGVWYIRCVQLITGCVVWKIGICNGTHLKDYHPGVQIYLGHLGILKILRTYLPVDEDVQYQQITHNSCGDQDSDKHQSRGQSADHGIVDFINAIVIWARGGPVGHFPYADIIKYDVC